MPLNIKPGNQVQTVRNLAGRARDWQSLRVEIDGATEITLTGVTALRYGETQDTQLNYGIGTYPVSKGYGNISAFGEITMAVYQLEDLLESVAAFTDDTRRPQNFAPFNLVVIWEDGNTGTRIKDTLYQCTIDNFEKNAAQNDMDISVTVNLNPVAIEWNAQA